MTEEKFCLNKIVVAPEDGTIYYNGPKLIYSEDGPKLIYSEDELAHLAGEPLDNQERVKENIKDNIHISNAHDDVIKHQTCTIVSVFFHDDHDEYEVELSCGDSIRWLGNVKEIAFCPICGAEVMNE
ncbi:MAG: hypothetical protein EGR23_12250 [Holdemanella biformis]|nr:hypothetical protein [Holdemanella biformis]